VTAAERARAPAAGAAAPSVTIMAAPTAALAAIRASPPAALVDVGSGIFDGSLVNLADDTAPLG